MNRKSKFVGFTLIELMVVILILAILAALVVPRLMGRTDQAKVAAAKTDISTFSSALQQFRLDCDRYPTSEEGLQALRQAPSDVATKWHGPYLDKEIPNDPWGTPYVYTFPGHEGATGPPDVISYGPDKAPGGGDDLPEAGS